MKVLFWTICVYILGAVATVVVLCASVKTPFFSQRCLMDNVSYALVWPIIAVGSLTTHPVVYSIALGILASALIVVAVVGKRSRLRE